LRTPVPAIIKTIQEILFASFCHIMNDVEIMADDLFSTTVDDQVEADIEESINPETHSDLSESHKAEERSYFFSKLKTIFEVSDERTAEEAKKFLKVYI
jgi:hypothetical protein